MGMSDPKPMDQRDLVKLWRSAYEAKNAEWRQALADRDHLEAEAKRYRARVQVTDGDIRAAGVTWAHVQEWARMSEDAKGHAHDYTDPAWMKWDAEENDGRQMRSLILATIKMAATWSRVRGLDKCELDVLDEIAAMEVSDG
jgi:hypothetical protein